MTETATQSAPKLILPFMNAVREVFKKMAQVDITVNKPHLKTEPAATYGICGIIGFSGDITGTVVVSFSNTAAEKLVEAFTGCPMDIHNPDFPDAIGELADMIAGSAKQHLGGETSISLPSVVIGAGYTLASLSSSKRLVIPCDSPHGQFTVEVSIKPNSAA